MYDNGAHDPSISNELFTLSKQLRFTPFTGAFSNVQK